MKKQWLLSIVSIGVFACLGETGFAQELPAVEGGQEMQSILTLESTFLSEENPDPTDPTNPVEPGEPTDPTDPVDPGEPEGPTDPVDPTDPIDPTEPIEPEEPTDPTDPTEPVEPEIPIEPEVPVDPEEPETPPTPEKPTEPSQPTPTEPSVPETPVTTPSVEQPVLTESGREIVGVENSVPIVKEADGSYTQLTEKEYQVQSDGTVQVKTKEGMKVLPKTGEAHQQGLSLLGMLLASFPVFVYFKKRSRHEEAA